MSAPAPARSTYKWAKGSNAATSDITEDYTDGYGELTSAMRFLKSVTCLRACLSTAPSANPFSVSGMMRDPLDVIEKAIQAEVQQFQVVAATHPECGTDLHRHLEHQPLFGQSIPTWEAAHHVPPSFGVVSTTSEYLKKKLVTKNCISYDMLQQHVRACDSNVVPLPTSTVLMKFILFHPHLYHKELEVLIPSTFTLAQLRDAFVCKSDAIALPAIQRTALPGSCMHIEHTIFDDTRATSSRAIDTLVPFALSKGAVCIAGTMETQSLHALSVRMGGHYSFMHQGDCTHKFVLAEMRMMTKADPTNANCYPLTVFRAPPITHLCSVCEVIRPAVVVVDDQKAVVSPAYYCTTCFSIAHPRRRPDHSPEDDAYRKENLFLYVEE